MRIWRKILVGLALAIAVMVADVPDAHAAINCNAALPGLTTRIVSCVRTAITGIAMIHFAQVRNDIRRPIIAVLIIYILFFGFKVVFAVGLDGKSRIKLSDAVKVLVTMLMVSYFVLDVGLEDYIGLFLEAQNALVDVVTSSIGTSTVGAACNGFTGEYAAWQRLDCTVATLLGAYPVTDPLNGYANMESDPFNRTTMSNMRFTLLIISAGLFFTPVGPLVFFLVFGIAGIVALAFIQAIFVYIQSLVIVVVLGIVGPICIPCVLFQPTQKIFQGWLQSLFAYTLQPMILLGYMAFMIHVMSTAMGFTGLTNLYAMTRDAAETRTMKDHVVTYSSPTQKYGCDDPATPSKVEECGDTGDAADPALASNKGAEAASLYMPRLEWITAPLEKLAALIQGLMVMTLTSALTLGFMHNVMSMGVQIAGIGAAPMTGALDIYNKSVGKIMEAGKIAAKAAEGYATGGEAGAARAAMQEAMKQEGGGDTASNAAANAAGGGRNAAGGGSDSGGGSAGGENSGGGNTGGNAQGGGNASGGGSAGGGDSGGSAQGGGSRPRQGAT